MDATYQIEEAIAGHHRGLVVRVVEDHAYVGVSFDADVKIEISLEELAFLARAAATLPEWVRDGNQFISAPWMGGENRKVTAKDRRNTSDAEKPTARPERQGKRWTEEEDASLVEAFQVEEQPIAAISKQLQRSPSAIVSRLLHLEIVDVVKRR